MKFNISRVITTTLSRTSGTKFFIVASFLLLASCKKESDIGSDVFPEDDNLQLSVTDTTSIIAYTVREDSLRSDESPIIQIGTLMDPDFGTTTAGLFTQLSIPNNQLNINFGSNAVLDSCALGLAYEFDYYGDTADGQTFNVYQMTEDIYKDSAYYSNRAKQYYTGVIGTTTVAPRPRTYVGPDTTTPPYLRIPIDMGFAQQIFNQSGGPSLADNAAFLQFMKGIYIASENVSGITGSLVRFKPLDSLTRLTLYYHDGADLKTFDFVINSTTAYYSYFTHSYSSTILNQVNNPGPGYFETYIQATAGLKTKIEFPFLDAWKNLGDPIAINKAELVIKADPGTATGDLPINKQLYLVSIDSAGGQHLLIDMFESSVYYGGTVNTTTSEYKINLARYFQDLVSGNQDNYGLYLKEIDPVASGRRTVIGSPNSTTGYKMYLRLVYTRVN